MALLFGPTTVLSAMISSSTLLRRPSVAWPVSWPVFVDCMSIIALLLGPNTVLRCPNFLSSSGTISSPTLLRRPSIAWPVSVDCMDLVVFHIVFLSFSFCVAISIDIFAPFLIGSIGGIDASTLVVFCVQKIGVSGFACIEMSCNEICNIAKKCSIVVAVSCNE